MSYLPYSEGTFTPTLIGASTAGTTTYSVQDGYYRRVGNLVIIQAVVTGTGATGTGNALFGGFPFTIKNQTQGTAVGSVLMSNAASWTWPTGSTSAAFQGLINSTTAIIFVSGTAVAGGALQMANAAFNFQFTLSYEV